MSSSPPPDRLRRRHPPPPPPRPLPSPDPAARAAAGLARKGCATPADGACAAGCSCRGRPGLRGLPRDRRCVILVPASGPDRPDRPAGRRARSARSRGIEQNPTTEHGLIRATRRPPVVLSRDDPIVSAGVRSRPSPGRGMEPSPTAPGPPTATRPGRTTARTSRRRFSWGVSATTGWGQRAGPVDGRHVVNGNRRPHRAAAERPSLEHRHRRARGHRSPCSRRLVAVGCGRRGIVRYSLRPAATGTPRRRPGRRICRWSEGEVGLGCPGARSRTPTPAPRSARSVPR